MKKALSFVLITALMVAVVSPVLAADNPAEKFTRGVVNVISGPLEIAKQLDTEIKASDTKAKKATLGVASGLFKGLAYTIGRMGSGIWDMMTFPFKVPENYEPVMKPDFVLDK